MDISFEGGYPTVISSKAVMLSDNKKKEPAKTQYPEIDNDSVAGKNFVPWGDDNDKPTNYDTYIQSTPSLRRAINDVSNVILGQGIIPVKVKGYQDSGAEELEYVPDKEVNKLVRSPMVRRYIAQAAFSLNLYGLSWVQFIPNQAGKSILQINNIKGKHGRFTEAKKGMVDNVLISGKWPDDVDANNLTTYPLLNEVDPETDLSRMKEEGKLSKGSILHALKLPFAENDYYPEPYWRASQEWVEIAQKIPRGIRSAMDNMMNVFILVRIPQSYWDMKYPKTAFQTEAERIQKIQSDVQTLEEKFTSVENARKALITHFNDQLPEAKWDIEIKEYNFNKENFVSSTAADTQVALAAGLHPDLMGLMYGNSKGGSMQRELLLLQYALSWNFRRLLLEPLEMMMRFNGIDPAIELRFRNTFLTTLDAGKGTSQVLS